MDQPESIYLSDGRNKLAHESVATISPRCYTATNNDAAAADQDENDNKNPTPGAALDPL